MIVRRNELIELFGAVIADRNITIQEFESLQDWFAAEPPLKRDEALFCLNAISRAFFDALEEQRLEIGGHEAVACMFLLWKSAWEKFCPAIRNSEHRVVFRDRWAPMQKMLESTKSTVDIAAFNFGEGRLVALLALMADQGKKIRIFVEDKNIGSVPKKLAKKKTLQVRVDAPSRLMHHKFVISDNNQVLTGSMNFTTNGFKVSHEGYIITDHPDIVEPYVQEFKKLWSNGLEHKSQKKRQ